MPAAPIQVSFLRTEIPVERNEYLLFSLNLIQLQISGERREGVELIIIKFSSQNNAKYDITWKIPWLDLSTGNKEVLNHPDSEKKPLEIIFPYSPGWNPYIQIHSLPKEKRRLKTLFTKQKQCFISSFKDFKWDYLQSYYRFTESGQC
ncbi:hypothetical protein RE474_06760 [Methanolobus sediminis]|uniref:Uncharacterized protein n=1 Tax=Methanolobus sediminis TaxID=3072978 RepID=A0AA51UHW7_9EURY|nr:hypothetical protein [Methanolobus sediminis]WMW23812.1 hypothetical protein RE474_06760 [Methanolobus sediminis]